MSRVNTTRYTLRDLLKIKNGRDHKELVSGSIPVYGSGGIMRFANKYLYNNESILLPRKGTLSNIQYVSKPFWTVDTTYYSIVNTELANVYYLYRYLRLLDLSRLNSGTGVPSMTFDAYYDIEVFLPEIQVQQKIASVLSSLDAKIELNNRINAELEAMAKTIYDYWFVQFDFPDANGKPYKTSGGKMVWSKELKREVPEGWEVKKINELIVTDKTGDWGKEALEGNYIIKTNCIRGADINGINGFGECDTPERYILEKNSFKILSDGDLVIEISGGSPSQSTGRMTFVTPEVLSRFSNPLICSNFCKPISLKNKKLIFIFAQFWNDLYINNVFFGYEGKTTGIKNLLFESVANSIYFIIPDSKTVEKYYQIASSYHGRKQLALKENQQLTKLRDWLLPMLMNGQVKVN